MIWGAAAVSLVTLGVGLILALGLRALPTVRLQLTGLAALAVCLPLTVVLLSGWVMFHMGDDVKILAVLAASATVAMIGGLFLARSIAGSIDSVRDAAVALSHGDRARPAPAREDRDRSLPADPPSDRLGRRLPPGAVNQ